MDTLSLAEYGAVTGHPLGGDYSSDAQLRRAKTRLSEHSGCAGLKDQSRQLAQPISTVDR